MAENLGRTAKRLKKGPGVPHDMRHSRAFFPLFLPFLASFYLFLSVFWLILTNISHWKAAYHAALQGQHFYSYIPCIVWEYVVY
jgi:hypothetical protein